MKQLTKQSTSANFREAQRLYLKDIDCPPEWHDALKRVIHPSLFYLNDNVDAKRDRHSRDDDDIFAEETKPAAAGDLMSSLPEEMRAQNLMCYIGHEGTYTPAHREMCASLGQNIMVETSKDANGEQEGSSIWFMTESKDRAVVREYFLSMLGHDIEIEKHFAQINAWKKAPFDVYVVEQKAGDFILIPPLAAHQVWNRGTRTMKVAWNRTTVDTLALALHEALPKARLVCRDEQYKNKAIIYFTSQKYYHQLQRLEKQAEATKMSFLGIGQDIVRSSPRTKQLAADFKKLVSLFGEVMVDEMFAAQEKEPEYIEFDSCVTCSYCRANIFNRFLTCKHCIRPLLNGDQDTYDVCMECYAMGRSCACLSGLQWCEQWRWSELVDNYETWRAMVIKNDGYIDIEQSPQPFEIARIRAGRRSVAEICQEALKRRPWQDITKPDREQTPSESEANEDGAKTKKKKSRKSKKGQVRLCHVCCHRDYEYKVHQCTNPGCNNGYCYGVLYRAFDMMPQNVLADEHWQCPKCLGICNCGACRRSGNTNAYTPKNTTLGLDTRPIADDRSIEALVDFRVHNLTWLKAAGEESRSKDSKRMKRLKEQADNEKASQASQQANEEDETSGHVSPPRVEVPAVNGYGDQSHILGDQPPPVDYSHGTAEGQEDAEANTTMTGTYDQADLADQSMYPDPTALAHQRIGMGYYEQDDTTDKILFDYYQAPSPSAMVFDKADVSEHVKKTIRALKRKQRKEEEDPEFRMAKSHRKKVRAPPMDPLDAMDPALFAQPDPTDHLTAEDIVALTASTQQQQTQQGNELSTSRGQRLYDANEPSLRHAKPRASYLEPEDMDVDLIEAAMEEARIQAQASRALYSPRGSPAPDQEGKSAADLAADAVRAMLGETASSGTPGRRGPGRPRGGGMPYMGKKRGRPPKNPPKTIATEHSDQADSSAKDVPEPLARRGRPRKSDAVKDPLVDPGTEQSGDDDATQREIEAQLVNQTAQEDLVTEPTLNRRGRPRRSGVTTISAASAALESADASPDESGDEDEDEDEDVESGVFSERRRQSAMPKRRGRARVQRTRETKVEESSFTSMRARMASRGRGFRIRGRGAGSRGTPSKASTQSISANSILDEAEDSDRSPPPPTSSRPPPQTGGDEDDYQSSSSASSIAASLSHGPSFNKLRGLDLDSDGGSDGSAARTGGVRKGRGSSRGKARGRGRGRGRGRARGTSRALA